MKYFSGFSLKGDASLFKTILKESDYTVAGFSFGAILAFEYALVHTERIDTLQLISPSFFHNRDKKFKRLQMIYFNRDPKAYERGFLANCFFPALVDESVKVGGGVALELEKLLNYEWGAKELIKLQKKGVNIEVYLGQDDKIIDAYEANSFFKQYATVYFMKNRGHFLQKGIDGT